MSITKIPDLSPAERTIIVKVDRYRDREPEGRLAGAGINGELTYRGLTQLLLAISSLVDEGGFAEAAEQLREFESDAPLGSRRQRAHELLPRASDVRPGRVATLALRILFRQHAGWQGRVAWLGEERELPFRSVLELITLVDSALYRDIACDNVGDNAADNAGATVGGIA